MKEGKGECEDFPHQDLIKSHLMKKTENWTNKKRKAHNTACTKYPKAAFHVHDKLEEDLEYMDEWATKEPQKKRKKLTKCTSDVGKKLKVHTQKGKVRKRLNGLNTPYRYNCL